MAVPAGRACASELSATARYADNAAPRISPPRGTRLPPISPERELRPRRNENVTDPNATVYKAYQRGRLRGAVMPIPENEQGHRWMALDLAGNETTWRYRNEARDHLCGPEPGA